MPSISAEVYSKNQYVLAANFLIALEELQAQERNFVSEPTTTGQDSGRGQEIEQPAPPAEHPAPAEETKPTEVTDITDGAIIVKLREFVTKHGTPAARTLLDKYGANRVGDVKAEDKAAFAAELAK